MKILNKIQKELKAPKNQRNNFGNYNYRSCEDILEAVKPLLGDAELIISDEMVVIGERYYVKSTAILKQGDEEASTTAYAREPENRKGMDEAQVTGATSSYARKYALNGLFLIDDTKDADTMDNSKKEATTTKKIDTISSSRAYIFSAKNIKQLNEFKERILKAKGLDKITIEKLKGFCDEKQKEFEKSEKTKQEEIIKE